MKSFDSGGEVLRRPTLHRSSGRRPQLNRSHRPVTRVSQPFKVWNSSRLTAYLRRLQAEYRPGEIPVARTWAEVAEEARRNIFNAAHVTALLHGLRGPWLASDVPACNLAFMLNRLRRLKSEDSDREKRRARVLKRNRQIQSAINWMRKLGVGGDVLAQLARGRIPLEHYSFHPLPRLGITRHPSKPIAWQAFWVRCIQQLYAYLKRTTQETNERIFKMTTRILHLASGAQYPDDWTLVKGSYYRALGREETHWTVGDGVWRKGQFVKTPEGLAVPVLGVESEGLIRAFILLTLALTSGHGFTVEVAVRMVINKSLLIKVALSGTLGQPGVIGLYPPDKLRTGAQFFPR